MEKSFRIHTNIIKDTLLNVNLKQDFDFMEILSLKLRQKDAYRLHSSNYGVIIGRVLANDAFGIPNAKISVFIERDENDPVDMENVYPYSEVTSKDKEGRRYNLLPDYSDDDCYRVVGTFPQKRYLLDDNIQLAVYDKYYKYTTVTNNAGDYMIFGVPTGSQTVHVDIDLSDIGILSQKPRDFTYRGYDLSEFDSPSQFKASTNYDSLRQIFSQDKSVYVYPFWGDAENGVAAITRCDVQIAYKFEPTCVFMGSIVSDNEGNSIGHKCAPNEENGMNAQLIAGEGTIEMIRKTTDGLVEEYPIQGNALIDSDGVWCYQIPMNLDYIGTDEYGNIVPTDNPTTGIPTRTQVRFRISKTETGNEGVSKHTAKYLVPMNPVLYEGPAKGGSKAKNPEIPMTQEETGEEMEKMYNFGSNTPQSCFRDLYWNNVYSVKNFIPKTQVAHRAYAPNYSALKGANLVEDQNPVPFNKLRIDLPFMYIVVCIIFRIIILIVTVINTLICGLNVILGFFQKIKGVKILGFKPFKYLFGWIPDPIGCIALSAGLEEGNIAYFPGCWCSNGLSEADCPEDMEDDCVKKGGYDAKELKDRIERNLARDFKIVKLDFYQDWINGVLYMPLWYWRKRKKKSFLFGLFVRRAKNEFCDCDKDYTRQKTFVTCEIAYNGNSLQTDDDSVDYDENRWHKRRTSRIWFTNGLIKGVENKDGLTAYYYTAFHANTSDNREHVMPIKQRFNRFYMVRLYATDIILLGNLNEDNYYGIPQLYKGLPSTTANIPLIATVQEDTTNKDDKTPSNDTDDATDVGTVITTGMDWGASGASQTPLYGEGLFMDLSCTYADTKAKSCINVERLSELGVGLDMTHNMVYSNGGRDVKYGKISTDGFITKYELDDMETRAMFATLNHIGFIPQDYQDKIGAYATQVQDEHTGYLIPKFKYIYPVDFDGRMSPIMENYSYEFNQASFDETDEAYLTFRLGAESSTTYTENEERRIRHFYFVGNKDYRMPLYNNSFFFYFGINKGSTAIDKFNKMFYAPCFQNDKKPFTFDYSSKGRSYCPSTYDKKFVKNYQGYAYIDVVLDDIQIPYSYSLFDEAGMEIISETGMTANRFIIGGKLESGEVISNTEGMVYYQVGSQSGTPVHNMYGDGGDGSSGLTNQTYRLTVTDVNGRSISEKIELTVPKIAVDYEAHQLGTRFYSTATTRIDYICTDETQFYGRLKITDFIVDGYIYNITDSLAQGYDKTSDSYIVWLTGQTDDISGEEEETVKQLTAYAVVKLGASDSPGPGFVRECLCDKENSATTKQRASDGVYINEAANSEPATTYWFADDKGVTNPNTFFVYQPNNFTLTITQICDGMELSGNTTSEIVAVNNGENFNAYLSDMPVKFMLGSVSDSSAATIANKSNFYRSNIDAEENGYPNGRHPLGAGVIGWFGLHQETTYRFNLPDAATVLRNTDVWLDYVNLKTPITSYKSKANILKFKFNSMFGLSKSGYVVDGTKPFTYTTRGGVNPILYRSVVPNYQTRNFLTRYLLSENNRATGRDDYPHIIGNNYASGYSVSSDEWVRQMPCLNRLYGPSRNYEVLGNYFAAFIQNGGYSSSTEIDSSIKVMKIPNYTKVTPRDTPREKVIGTDEIRGIDGFGFTFEKRNNYQPYLRSIFVDRRFDFDLSIIAPVYGDSINLYPHKEQEVPVTNPMPGDTVTTRTLMIPDGREKIWKSARISGWTYNGIEMSYDRDYNIISANTTYYPNDDEEEKEDRAAKPASATPMNRLEYSYYIPEHGTDGDAITYYNTEPNMIWEVDAYDQYQVDENGNIVYDDDGNPIVAVPADTKHQILKRYYEASFGGFDIRNFFWSEFNEQRLSESANSDTNKITASAKDVPYIFKHPPVDMKYNLDPFINGYNGDFNMENVSAGTIPSNHNSHNWPTTRAIDICNVTPMNSYEFNILPCSYRISAAVNEDGKIECKAVGDDGLSFMHDFGQPISFLPPNDDSNDYCNVSYAKDDMEKGYRRFNASQANLYFKYNATENELFDIYTSVPRVIRVLPYFTGGDGNKYDGISYMKTVTTNGEIGGSGTLDDQLKPDGPTVLHYFRRTSGNLTNLLLNRVDIFTPANIGIDDNMKYKNSDEVIDWSYFFYNNETGEYVTSDCDEFQNIKFKKDEIDISDVMAFSVVVDRRCLYIDDDMLKRRLRLTEFSEIYDCRKVLMKISGDKNETYIQCKVIGGTEVEVPVEHYVSANTEYHDDTSAYTTDVTTETEMETGSGENKVHIQVITFNMLIETKEPNGDPISPINSESEALANYSMMGYTFRFDNGNDTFDIQPTSAYTTTAGTDVIVHFMVRWPSGMGVLADEDWSNSCYCTVFAKTQSGFIYKLNRFKISFDGQEGSYEPSTKTSSMNNGDTAKTNASM